MDKTSVVGTVLGLVLVAAGIGFGSLKSFIHLDSMFIVFGGSLSALLVAYKMERFKAVLNGIKMVYQLPKEYNFMKLISNILTLSEAARKEGLLALESRIAGIDEPFLARLMQLVIDSVEPNLINEVIETEIASTSQRHADIKDALDFLASITPAFGMIGTIIGLVNLLKDLSDPSTIGPNMSIALITTFYGTIVANLFIMPFAKKLEERAAAEDMYNEIIGRGVILIASGTNPRIVQEKLLSYMSQKSRTIFSELHLSEELSNA